jgi:hypothetical protein
MRQPNTLSHGRLLINSPSSMFQALDSFELPAISIELSDLHTYIDRTVAHSDFDKLK